MAVTSEYLKFLGTWVLGIRRRVLQYCLTPCPDTYLPKYGVVGTYTR